MPRVDFFGTTISGSTTIGPFYYFFGLSVVIVMALAFRNLLRSKFGRALVAVRDNDRAADAMGINPGATKVMAFAVAGFYAGVAGVLLAFYNGSVIVESFTLGVSIDFLAMAIVGGLGTLVGSLIGPAFLQFLDPWVEGLAGALQGDFALEHRRRHRPAPHRVRPHRRAFFNFRAARPGELVAAESAVFQEVAV